MHIYYTKSIHFIIYRLYYIYIIFSPNLFCKRVQNIGGSAFSTFSPKLRRIAFDGIPINNYIYVTHI